MTVFKKIVIALVVLVVAVGGLTAALGINEIVQAQPQQDGVNLSALDTGESVAVPLSWQGTATIWFLAGLQTPQSGSTPMQTEYFSGYKAGASSPSVYLNYSPSEDAKEATALNLRIAKGEDRYTFMVMTQSDGTLFQFWYLFTEIQQYTPQLEGLELWVRVGTGSNITTAAVVSETTMPSDFDPAQGESNEFDNVVPGSSLNDATPYIMFAFQAPPITEYVEGIYNDFYLYDIGQDPQKINGAFTYVNTEYHPMGVSAGDVTQLELSFATSGATMNYKLTYTSGQSTTYIAVMSTRYGSAFISFISHVTVTITEYQNANNVLYTYTGAGNPFSNGSSLVIDDVALWNVEYAQMRIDFEAEGYSAYEDGRADGYDEGYGAGHEVGYDEGYDVGTSDGYEDGYNAGYAVGLEEVQPSASTMVAAAGNLLNADIFGTWSLADILTIMIGLACAIAFLKLFAGG